MSGRSRIVIVADDFTGAMDTAAQFAGVGTRVVAYPEEYGKAENGDADVIAVNTESRGLTSRSAYDTVFEVSSRSFRSADPGDAVRGLRVYKKIDSTMRGNVGAEIDAALDALGLRFAVVTPAFPGARRTVENGTCLVFGVPLAESPSGNDPFTPVASSRVDEIIEAQSKRKVAVLELASLRSGPELFSARITKAVGEGNEICVVDATTDADLELLASVCLNLEPSPLLAGSGGFARGIASVIRAGEAPPVCPPPEPGVLVVNGSLMPAALAQIRRLESIFGPAVYAPETTALVASPPPTDAASALTRRLEASGVGIVSTGGVRPGAGESGREYGSGLARRVSAWIAETVELVARRAGIILRTIVIVGGDTARNTLGHLSVESVEVLGEYEPGVVRARTVAAPGGQAYNLVTKSGGFGDEATLERICRLSEEC